MKILPFVSRSIAWLQEDGAPASVPLQVMRTSEGQTVIRVGRNTIWFDQDGRFDGTEHTFAGLDVERDDPRIAAVKTILEASRSARGHAPDVAYFEPGSTGFAREIAGWPASERPNVQDAPDPASSVLNVEVAFDDDDERERRH